MKMKNNRCPSCGRVNPREMRQCPKRGGIAVCVQCCENCETYEPQDFHCTWHIVNKTIFIDDEIKRLKYRIEYLEREASRQYKRNKPHNGNLLLNEEKSCTVELNRLERLREQGFKYI